jgi:hypothetical protein
MAADDDKPNRNRIVPPDEWAREALTVWKQETARVAALTPEQLQAEIEAMSPEDRRYVEHGY